MLKLKTSGCNGRGIACFFYKCTEESGLKVYADSSHADMAWENQRRLWQAGVALMPGDRIEVELTVDDTANNDQVCTGYAFWTPIARVVGEFRTNGMREFIQAGETLRTWCQNNRIKWLDDHYGNYGICRDTGKAVFIDTADNLYHDGKVAGVNW